MRPAGLLHSARVLAFLATGQDVAASGPRRELAVGVRDRLEAARLADAPWTRDPKIGELIDYVRELVDGRSCDPEDVRNLRRVEALGVVLEVLDAKAQPAATAEAVIKNALRSFETWSASRGPA